MSSFRGEAARTTFLMGRSLPGSRSLRASDSMASGIVTSRFLDEYEKQQFEKDRNVSHLVMKHNFLVGREVSLVFLQRYTRTLIFIIFKHFTAHSDALSPKSKEKKKIYANVAPHDRRMLFEMS